MSLEKMYVSMNVGLCFTSITDGIYPLRYMYTGNHQHMII